VDSNVVLPYLYQTMNGCINKWAKNFDEKTASHVVLLLKIKTIALLRPPEQRLLMLFNGLVNPQNCPFVWGSRHPPKAWLLGPTISINSELQPFLQGCRTWPTERHTTQTHRPR